MCVLAVTYSGSSKPWSGCPIAGLYSAMVAIASRKQSKTFAADERAKIFGETVSSLFGQTSLPCSCALYFELSQSATENQAVFTYAVQFSLSE
jgi:hypothetical protein